MKPRFFLLAGLVAAVAAVPAAANSPTRVTLHTFPGAAVDIVGSSAQLVRSEAGAAISVHTLGLNSGDAYTAWGVIFNNPENCDGGCGPDDLRRAGVDASVERLTGHVVGNGGNANFGGSLKVGDTSEALFGPGLTDPFGAEIHIVVKDHGPAIPEILPGALHTAGVCNPDTGCHDQQAAAFLP